MYILEQNTIYMYYGNHLWWITQHSESNNTVLSYTDRWEIMHFLNALS